MAEEKRKKGDGDGDEKKKGDGDLDRKGDGDRDRGGESKGARGVPITAQIVNNLSDSIMISRVLAAQAIRTLQEDGVLGRSFTGTEEAVLRRAEGK